MDTSPSLAAVLLRRWRDSLSLSQTEASARLGVDQARYSQFERGVRKPGRRLAVSIESGTGGHVAVASWDLPAPASASESPEVR